MKRLKGILNDIITALSYIIAIIGGGILWLLTWILRIVISKGFIGLLFLVLGVIITRTGDCSNFFTVVGVLIISAISGLLIASWIMDLTNKDT